MDQSNNSERFRKSKVFMGLESDENDESSKYPASKKDDIRFSKISMNENKLNSNLNKNQNAFYGNYNENSKMGNFKDKKGSEDMEEQSVKEEACPAELDNNPSFNEDAFFNNRQGFNDTKGEYGSFMMRSTNKIQKMSFESTASKTRNRTTPDQLLALERVAKTTMRPNKETRLRLASELNMNQRQVQIWFQNKRAKMKKQIEIVKLESRNGQMLADPARNMRMNSEYNRSPYVNQDYGRMGPSNSNPAQQSGYLYEPSGFDGNQGRRGYNLPRSPYNAEQAPYPANKQQANPYITPFYSHTSYLRDYSGLNNRFSRDPDEFNGFDAPQKDLLEYYSEPFIEGNLGNLSNLKGSNYSKGPSYSNENATNSGNSESYEDDSRNENRYFENSKDRSQSFQKHNKQF